MTGDFGMHGDPSADDGPGPRNEEVDAFSEGYAEGAKFTVRDFAPLVKAARALLQSVWAAACPDQEPFQDLDAALSDLERRHDLDAAVETLGE